MFYHGCCIHYTALHISIFRRKKTSLEVNLCWKWKDVGVLIHACTDKNHRKRWRKRQIFLPNFLKWEYFCQNWRIIIRQFWEKYSHFGENSLSFSQHFLMIFVSVCYLHVHSLFCCLLAHAYKQCLHFDWLFYCHLVFIDIIADYD